MILKHEERLHRLGKFLNSCRQKRKTVTYIEVAQLKASDEMDTSSYGIKCQNEVYYNQLRGIHHL